MTAPITHPDRQSNLDLSRASTHGQYNDAPVIGLLVAEYVKADVLGLLLIDDMGEARFEHLRRNPGVIDALLRG
ncbi:hypothetical protein ACTTAL_19280 (plasmid) [Rhodobacter capsulatus]